MPPSRKRRKGADDEDLISNDSESEEDEAKGQQAQLLSPSSDTTVCVVADSGNGNAFAKLKCRKCFRVARKDCTGGLCIRCCTDENCLVHQEQKARARWKEAVVAGTTEIQTRAKRKRARSIPPGRFREKAFRYMNDTIVLWDLRTVLSPPPPQTKQQHYPGQQSQQSPSKPMDRDAGEQPLTSTTVPASALAEYQEDLKTREDILRRSRKNNESGESTKTGFRRNYRGTKTRFRSVVEALYEKSLDAELII